VAFDGSCFTKGHSSFDKDIRASTAESAVVPLNPGWPVFSPASDATDRSWL